MSLPQTSQPKLGAALRQRHVTMIALGGIIGAGLFVGSSATLATVGPAACVSYLVAGIVVLMVMRMLGEMALAVPGVGSFTEYARIGGSTGDRYTEFQHSLFVLATVMSVPARERAIVDAGLKSYSTEKGLPWIHGRVDVEVTGASDEHGNLRVAPRAAPLHLGEKVLLIPGHCDPTVNLHDWFVAVRNGRVEALWPITARGASS